MREIALHLLDIAENSVAAQAKTITIFVDQNLPNDRLLAKVEDDGRGMDETTMARVVDPFYTSRTTRKVGLGIPLLKAAAEACNGYLVIRSTLGAGTCLEVAFQNSHIDRMPLGDLSSTFLTLLIAYPQIRWLFTYQCHGKESRGGSEFSVDSMNIVNELAGIPLTEPTVLNFLRNYLDEGVGQVALFASENEELLGLKAL